MYVPCSLSLSYICYTHPRVHVQTCDLVYICRSPMLLLQSLYTIHFSLHVSHSNDESGRKRPYFWVTAEIITDEAVLFHFCHNISRSLAHVPFIIIIVLRCTFSNQCSNSSISRKHAHNSFLLLFLPALMFLLRLFRHPSFISFLTDFWIIHYIGIEFGTNKGKMMLIAKETTMTVNDPMLVLRGGEESK